MQNKSVVVGVDIGSWTFKLSAFVNQKLDVLVNQANFRETPSLVAFLQAQRLVGQQAQNKIKSNYMNTVRAPLRLIGIEKNFDLIDQELKYCTTKYEVGQELTFSIEFNQTDKNDIKPEHLLISLMAKIYKIVQSHKLTPIGYYLTIPSYLSHYQRKIIKRCGEIVLHSYSVTLIDDWLSIASDYAYNRVAELKSGHRAVVFVDIGYSKSSFFVIEFTPKEPILLDCEHMRFIGSKNMDHLITEYYDQKMKTDRKTQESIFSSRKAVVKIFDHVEKQRKVLSANQDCHINVEALFEDYDLSYNMDRGELEKIVEPVLLEIKKGLKNLKNRMPIGFNVHSIELIGGGSRMPYVRTIIKDVFGLQPSRTLNLSETTARGATIYGAVKENLISLDYNICNKNLVDVCICWNPTGNKDIFFGENEAQYKNHRTIFNANTYVPCQTSLKLGKQGPVQLYIYYKQTVSTKSVGYLRFKTPNQLNFTIDDSKIISVTLEQGKFDLCKMQDKKQAKWQDIAQWQRNLSAVEERIKMLYEIKNQFEGKFYDLRSRIGQYQQYMNLQEQESFKRQFSNIQKWIQTENDRPLSSIEDLALYQNEFQCLLEYEEALEILKGRRLKSQGLITQYRRLTQGIDSISPQSLNKQQLRKIGQLIQWLKDSYNKMQQCHWDGYYITENSLNFAEQETKRILNQ